MQSAGAFVAFRPTAELVSIARDPSVQWSPNKHAPGEMQERRGPPQSPQPARQIANRLWTPMSTAEAIHDHHFLHHAVEWQVRPAAGNFGVVQRKIRELLLAIPPGQLADLGRADATLAIVDHDVALRPLRRRRQWYGGRLVGSDGHRNEFYPSTSRVVELMWAATQTVAEFARIRDSTTLAEFLQIQLP
jgi:hypothetical protein